MFYKVVAIVTYLKSPNNKLAFSTKLSLAPEIWISNGNNANKSEKDFKIFYI